MTWVFRAFHACLDNQADKEFQDCRLASRVGTRSISGSSQRALERDGYWPGRYRGAPNLRRRACTLHLAPHLSPLSVISSSKKRTGTASTSPLSVHLLLPFLAPAIREHLHPSCSGSVAIAHWLRPSPPPGFVFSAPFLAPMDAMFSRVCQTDSVACRCHPVSVFQASHNNGEP
jgi:hypothetical protein